MKRKLLTAVACVGILAGCTIAHPTSTPQLTFSNYAPLSLNAQTVDVLDSSQSKVVQGDVSDQFILAPDEAVKRYASNRFQSAGVQGGQFQMDITDSAVTMRQIEQQNRALAWSGVGKEDEYRIFLQIRLTLSPAGFNGTQVSTIKFDRTLVMPSSTTLVDRDIKQTKFMEQLIRDLDAKISEAMDQTPAIRG